MLFRVRPARGAGLRAQAHQAPDAADCAVHVREAHAPGGVRAVRGREGV